LRINPFEVNTQTITLVEQNIQDVLRNYISCGYRHVILTWVLHRQEIIDRIAAGLGDTFSRLFVFTLVCDEATLATRFNNDPGRGAITERAVERLQQTRDLATRQIDTSDLIPREITESIGTVLSFDSSAAT
jgi:hypothetical protein